MKKTIIIIALLLASAISVFAQQHGVFMEYHRKSKPESQTQVNRSPMHIPIDVIYTSEDSSIEILGDCSLCGEVYLYDINGVIVDYSPNIITKFQLPSSSSKFFIVIEGENWWAEGEISTII